MVSRSAAQQTQIIPSALQGRQHAHVEVTARQLPRRQAQAVHRRGEITGEKKHTAALTPSAIASKVSGTPGSSSSPKSRGLSRTGPTTT
jgi:hypothetical protein